MAVAGVRFSPACVSVCFPHHISKAAAAGITKHDSNVPPRVLENYLFWGQKVKGQGHESQKNSAGVGFSILVSDGFL